MWLAFAFLSALLLGFYDVFKKQSLNSNAVEYKTLRSQRTVYGGGGIQPDVKVESDTTRVSDYMARIVAQGVYSDFLMEYMDRFRPMLDEQYPTFQAFESGFRLNDDIMAMLIRAATKRGIEYNDKEYAHSKELIRTQLTAMIAQRLYSAEEFYRVMNPRENQSYIKAMEILSNWESQGAKILAGEN